MIDSRNLSLLVVCALWHGLGTAHAATPQVAAGIFHAIALDSAGTLRTWGSDYAGQLGTGRALASTTPLQVAIAGSIAQMASGESHSLALDSQGRLWAWGRNLVGQLGNGTTTDSSTPVLLGNGYSAVAASGKLSVALKADGTVWAWGYGGNSQLVLGSMGTKSPVALGSGYTKIAAGYGIILALKGDGSLWQWTGGFSAGSAQVPGSYTDMSAGIGRDAASGNSVAIKSDGSLWTWAYGQTTVSAVQATGAFKRVAVGYRNVLAVTTDGALWQWLGGIGAKPALVGTGYANAAAGEDFNAFVFSLAVKTDGSLWAWGSNRYGRLGDGSTTDRATPMQVGNGYRAVVAGLDHSLGLKTDGTLWAWGDNQQGQLGDAAVIRWSIPFLVGSGFIAAAAGAHHSLAIKSDASLYAWGENSMGQLGNGTNILQSSPVLIGSGYAAVAAGGFSSAAIKTDGSLWAWGSQTTSSSGNSSNSISVTRPIQMGSGYTRVAVGYSHFLALKTDGSLWAWGNNQSGQLGDGTVTLRTTPVLIGSGYAAIAAGAFHSLAVKSDGSLWKWGNCPIGTANAICALPAQIGSGFSFVAAGWDHSVAVKTDRTLWAWGTNSNGQIGDGSTTDRSAPVSIGNGFAAVSAGQRSSLALASDGTVITWGLNNEGQLGNGTLAHGQLPGYAVNDTATDLLDLNTAAANQINTAYLPAFFLQASYRTGSLSATLTDTRASGFPGAVYYAALLPADSPLLSAGTPVSANGFAAEAGVQPVAFGRGGAKQTGPAVAAEPVYIGVLSAGNQFAAYDALSSDPLAGSNAVICMGVTIPALSAKGQVLMRAIANGDQDVGVTQCPTVQTEATIQLYTGQVSGTTISRTIVARIQAQPEDYGQRRNIYSWAVTPDGRQFMQTGPNVWTTMSEPMAAAMAVTVPADGSPVTLAVVQNLNLSSLVGTLVYVGLGSSWVEVKQLNKAGHYYTVQ